MPANTDPGVKPGQSKDNDALANALEREKAAPPGEMPVKQHNPEDKGMNPDQRGPAQPSGGNA